MADATPAEVAEDLDAYVLRPRSATRDDRGYVVLIDGPDPTPLGRFASRVRLPARPDSAVAAVRAWFGERHRDAFTWKLGTHTTPGDLEAILRAHGAHEDAAEPEHTALVLEREPPAVSGIEVRVVESYEDYVQSAEIMFVGFGGSFSADELAEMRAALSERYADYREHSAIRRYLAFSQGTPVAMATAIQTSARAVVALGGGATLPAARGRGAYRALVHARWVDAVRSGSTALVTQASGMSRPILERLGFRAVGPVLELIDTTDLGLI